MTTKYITREQRSTLQSIFEVAVGTFILIGMLCGIVYIIYTAITVQAYSQQEKLSLCEDNDLLLNEYSGSFGECYKTLNSSYYAIPIINVNGTYYLDMNRARVTK